MLQSLQCVIGRHVSITTESPHFGFRLAIYHAVTQGNAGYMKTLQPFLHKGYSEFGVTGCYSKMVEAAGIEPARQRLKTDTYVTMCPICASLASIFSAILGLVSSIQRPYTRRIMPQSLCPIC
jgi:hypothetical protein